MTIRILVEPECIGGLRRVLLSVGLQLPRLMLGKADEDYLVVSVAASSQITHLRAFSHLLILAVPSFMHHEQRPGLGDERAGDLAAGQTCVFGG